VWRILKSSVEVQVNSLWTKRKTAARFPVKVSNFIEIFKHSPPKFKVTQMMKTDSVISTPLPYKPLPFSALLEMLPTTLIT